MKKCLYSLKIASSAATRQQQPDESVDQYMQILKKSTKDCDFQAVTAVQVRNKYIQDAFINRILSNHTRQGLLENKTLDLHTAYDQTLMLKID